MKYKRLDDAAKKRQLYVAKMQQLYELYRECSSFDEFRTKALEKYGYDKPRCLDPFWIANKYIEHPVLFWVILHAIAVVVAFVFSSLMFAVLCSLSLESAFVWFVCIISYVLSYGTLFASMTSYKNDIISKIAHDVDVYGVIY